MIFRVTSRHVLPNSVGGGITRPEYILDAMIPHRFFSTTLAMFVFAGLVSADAVKLKNGEVLKGNILAENADSITIEYEVSSGIKDEKTIPRDQIISVAKEDPADKAWAELTKSIPTADLLGLADYDTLIDRANGFIRTHASSIKAGQARRLVESLREERNRVAKGDMKLEGTWIAADQYQREKFWFDGRIALRTLAKANQTGRYLEALRQFAMIESNYAGTTILARAIPESTIALKRYAAAVNESLANQPRLAEQRAKRMGTLSPVDRAATEQAQLGEAASFKAKVEAERKAGAKWLSLDPYDAASLKEALVTIEKEITRIAAIDTSNAVTNEALLRQIGQAINEGRMEGAEDLIQKASKTLQGSPYLKTLDDRVKSEIARISAEKKATDDARKDAEKRATMVVPKPKAPATKSAEDLAIEQATSPIAKAVRESDLGKRVAGDKPAEPVTPPPEPEPEPRAPAAEETITPPTPAPAETVVPAAATKPAPAKKADGGSLTPILYGIAGVLGLALLGLLLMPLLKKKQEDPAPTHAPANDPEIDNQPAVAEEIRQAEASESKPEE